MDWTNLDRLNQRKGAQKIGRCDLSHTLQQQKKQAQALKKGQLKLYMAKLHISRCRRLLWELFRWWECHNSQSAQPKAQSPVVCNIQTKWPLQVITRAVEGII